MKFQLTTYENVNNYKGDIFLTHTDLIYFFPQIALTSLKYERRLEHWTEHMHGFIFYLGLYIVCALFRHLTGIVRCPGMFAMQIFDFKNSLAIEYSLY